MSLCTLLCLILLAQAAPPARADGLVAAVEEMPQCGVAATYAVLKLLDRPISLRELLARFRRLNKDVNLRELSLADLRGVLQGCGLYARAMRVEPGKIGSVPVPAILYLRPERIGRAHWPGHFVVLCAVDRTTAEILDLTVPRGRVQVPLERLGQTWDGELLAVSRRPFGPSRVVQVRLAALLFCLAAAAGLVWGRLRGRSSE